MSKTKRTTHDEDSAEATEDGAGRRTLTEDIDPPGSSGELKKYRMSRKLYEKELNDRPRAVAALRVWADADFTDPEPQRRAALPARHRTAQGRHEPAYRHEQQPDSKVSVHTVRNIEITPQGRDEIPERATIFRRVEGARLLRAHELFVPEHFSDQGRVRLHPPPISIRRDSCVPRDSASA